MFSSLSVKFGQVLVPRVLNWTYKNQSFKNKIGGSWFSKPLFLALWGTFSYLNESGDYLLDLMLTKNYLYSLFLKKLLLKHFSVVLKCNIFTKKPPKLIKLTTSILLTWSHTQVGLYFIGAAKNVQYCFPWILILWTVYVWYIN